MGIDNSLVQLVPCPVGVIDFVKYCSCPPGYKFLRVEIFAEQIFTVG